MRPRPRLAAPAGSRSGWPSRHPSAAVVEAPVVAAAPPGSRPCARARRCPPPRRPTGTPILMPALGESVTEGTVTRWLKAVGDTVAVDEPLLEVSTDKVDTEIPSPVAGVLVSIPSARTRPSPSAPPSA